MDNNKKSKEINEQVKFGLDSINSESTIELKLKDFMLVYKTFEEFNRFFHQRAHYSTIEDVHTYLGDLNSGAFSIISEIYYKILPKYLPKQIEDKFGEENNPFDYQKPPYYFKVKNDESVNDGTQHIKTKESFVSYVNNMLESYENGDTKWDNDRIENFLQGISSYAEDINGYYSNMKFDTSAEIATWRIFAQILKGATIYE